MGQKLSLFLLVAGFSLVAEASELRCNREQSKCSVENVRLTIGDQIGILNEDKELVATAEVEGIQGRQRRLNIQKRHGKIYNSYQLARLDSEHSHVDSYKIYKPSLDRQITAIAEIASMGIGEGIFSYGVQGYYEAKLKENIYWTGRGMFLTGSGHIRSPHALSDSSVSTNTFGALGGLAYKTKRRGDFVLRSELGLGMAYTMANLDGDASLADEHVEQLSNGVGFATRLEFQVVYQGMSWSPALVGSLGTVQSARVGSIGIAFSKGL